uniref:Major facilitator superfamily (MFS) profile domain-containing protein n=1 Tax=Timema shepardi TaxID=629360 RepID=A0A7R9B7Z5_TIMSH|nr:unnamed protein product [Timema shepardi]
MWFGEGQDSPHWWPHGLRSVTLDCQRRIVKHLVSTYARCLPSVYRYLSVLRCLVEQNLPSHVGAVWGMDGDKLPLQTGRKLPQYLAACISSINTICCGSVFAWSAPALPYLQSALAGDDTTTHSGGNYTYYNVSEDLGQHRVRFDNNASIGLLPDNTVSVAEGSIISSLVAIGCLVGSLPAGQLANAFGRRTMLQVMNVPLLVGWIIIIFADRHVALLCTARFIQGISLGLGAVMAPLYNEEIADARVRGSLGVIYDLMLTVGILWVYTAGASLPYLWLNISSAFTAVSTPPPGGPPYQQEYSDYYHSEAYIP